MQQLIVFECLTETIVGNALAVDQLVIEWFIETDRDIAAYELSIIDANEGVALSGSAFVDPNKSQRVNLADVVGLTLRARLVELGILDEDLFHLVAAARSRVTGKRDT